METNKYSPDSAASLALANCHICHMVSPISNEICPRCGEKLHLRTPKSIQMTLAFVFTAVLFYIPANLYPIMTTTVLGDKSGSTIISGVLLFWEQKSYFIAFVIFTASVLIPLTKIVIILWLCYSTQRKTQLNHRDLTRMYRVMEFVGKWSMIDIFVVAILVALVQLAELMSIQPGVAASAFAMVVILTMIAAHQFDVRLIWDKMESL